MSRYPTFDDEALAETLARAKTIFRTYLGLDAVSLVPLSRGYNNSLFRVTVTLSLERLSFDLAQRPQLVGTVPLSSPCPKTMVLRFPRMDGAAGRLENAIATAAFVREGGTLAQEGVRMPAVHAWSSQEGDVWSIEEWIEGVPLDLVWEDMSIQDKAPLIEEIVRVIAAFKNTPLPDSPTAVGGLAFAKGTAGSLPKITISTHPIVIGGPFTTSSAYYQHLFRQQLEKSAVHPLLRGWSDTGDLHIAERVRTFLDEGGLEKALTDCQIDELGLVLNHGDFDLMNILLTPFKPYRVLAILDFEFSHVGPPSEEYFLSLPFVGHYTDGPDPSDDDYTTNLAREARLLEGDTADCASDEQDPDFLMGVFDQTLENVAPHLRWSRIPQFEEIKRLHWFSQTIYQWYYDLDKYRSNSEEARSARDPMWTVTSEASRLDEYLRYFKS